MTNTDNLLEELEEVLEDATSFPMSKKSLVDVDKIKVIIEDIRLNTPQETKQAKAIVDNRNNIINEAKLEAENIIKKAHADAAQIVAKDEITRRAQSQANEIMAQAEAQSKSIVSAAQNEANEIMSTASQQSNEMVSSAQTRSREMMAAAKRYADDSLLQIDESLYNALNDVRRVRQGLENVGRRSTQEN